MKLTKAAVQFAVSGEDPWRLGNQVLYDLCRDYPRHNETSEIVAKVWLIGRAYSASIERGRGKAESGELSNDRFYSEVVPDALKSCGIDAKLTAIEQLNEDDESSVSMVLDAHACLVRTFRKLTNKDKRSLASKYLHFHLPKVVFIFDSRAMSSIRSLGVPQGPVQVPRGADQAYARFVGAAIGLRAQVLSEFGHSLTPRQLDRLLLASFESRNL